VRNAELWSNTDEPVEAFCGNALAEFADPFRNSELPTPHSALPSDGLNKSLDRLVGKHRSVLAHIHAIDLAVPALAHPALHAALQ